MAACRAPVFLRLRDDKPPGDVHWARMVEAPGSAGQSTPGNALDFVLDRFPILESASGLRSMAALWA